MQKILGIDVGTHSIKACLMGRSFSEFEVLRFEQRVIHSNSRLTYEEQAAGVIKSIVESGDFSADTIVTSLPSHHLSFRFLELPFTNLKKVSQTYQFELESFVPLSLDELLVDYHVLSAEENQSHLLCASVSKERMKKFLDIFRLAGVEPKYVGADVMDLSVLSQVAMIPNNSTYAIMDIGHEKTNICVMEGSKIKYVRSITMGGLHVTKAIQKAYKLSLEKAESLKMERGKVSLTEDSLDQIALLCQKAANDLVVAIKHTLLGYRQIYPQSEWFSLFITGGGSKLSGLADYLSSALQMHVGVLDSTEFLKHKLDSPEMVRDYMGVSVGQTLRVVMPNQSIRVNFRQDEFAYKQEFEELGSDIRKMSLMGVFLFLLGCVYFVVSYYTLNSQVKNQEEQMMASVLKAMPDLKDEVKGSKRNVQSLVRILDGKTSDIRSQLETLGTGFSEISPLAVLLEISKKMPPKNELVVDIDEFSYTAPGKPVLLKGSTDSFESLDKIKKALETSILFKSVTIQQQDRRDVVKFTLSIEFKEGEES